MIEYIKKAGAAAGRKKERESGKAVTGTEVRVLRPAQLHVA